MKILNLIVLFPLWAVLVVSCSQNDSNTDVKSFEKPNEKVHTVHKEPHRYGGWYCPDNLNGFPPVDIADWENVPVVNGRMPTQEEARNGSSLIFVDMVKYPNAKPLDMKMPKLASFYSNHTKREELIIVIQAVNIDNDSIVGFRYLNGGNGSARLSEVRLLENAEIESIPSSRFVSYDIKINATQDEIWKILRKPENAEAFKSIFEKGGKVIPNWSITSNVNFYYTNKGIPTALFADKVFGCYYIQNDFLQYNEKFLLLENPETKQTELKIVCGPFIRDYDMQKEIVGSWAQKVKELSEKKG